MLLIDIGRAGSAAETFSSLLEVGLLGIFLFVPVCYKKADVWVTKKEDLLLYKALEGRQP